MPWALIGFFFITAMLYAAVGFGGGSTYSALLVLSGTDYRILPTLALSCIFWLSRVDFGVLGTLAI